MKTPLTGVLPPSPLQRLKTWATLTHSKKTLQSHREQAMQLQQKAEALMQRGKHAQANALHEKAHEHEQTAERLEEAIAKKLLVY